MSKFIRKLTRPGAEMKTCTLSTRIRFTARAQSRLQGKVLRVQPLQKRNWKEQWRAKNTSKDSTLPKQVTETGEDIVTEGKWIRLRCSPLESVTRHSNLQPLKWSSSDIRRKRKSEKLSAGSSTTWTLGKVWWLYGIRSKSSLSSCAGKKVSLIMIAWLSLFLSMRASRMKRESLLGPLKERRQSLQQLLKQQRS